jgi:hypothetical protein
MRLEAKGSYGKAEDTYKDILEKDPTDQVRKHSVLVVTVLLTRSYLDIIKTIDCY